MGNCCHKGKQRFSDETNNVMPVTGTIVEVVDAGAGTSAVVQWERRQKELNLQVMEKMREDFHNRPDNFLLNLLVVSFQFYQNYGREKADISNHIRDRELALDCKLSPSKRKIIYQGGLEEISGTHVLYQPNNEQYMELPTPLQIYVVQDNVEVYSEDQYEELQKMNYADVDGPAYRFCTESSQRHKGYVRLRCADIIPAMSRHNTYEDIYGFMKPPDESLPDPIVDIRPLRRNSQTLSSNDDNPMTMTPDSFSYTRSISSEFEDTDDDEPPSPPPPQRLTARRSSGVLPEHYPTGKLKERINKMKEEAHEHFSNGHPGAQIRPTRPRNLTERRPSGVFPKVGPDMDRLRLSSKQRQLMSTRDGMADIIKKLSKVEEDSEEEEEDEKQEVNVNMKKISHDEFQNDTNTETNIEIKKTKEVCLEARLNEDCFLTRRLRMKEQKDAYGITTKSERRTYFSSERYLECFEDEFEDLAKILGKEHLVDTCKMLTPAVLANELMIEHIGPKFNTEFIPTMILKEWPTCAFEWKLRERRPRADPETKMVYKWPKDQNIQEAVQLGCNLVPLGHYNPKEPNKVMKIEWQIQFAKGEQILLRSLGHTQIRLLLLVEFLMRDHLEDIPGLKTQHLRYILFWMCEHNFRDWQEERLGNKLKAYFKTLYNCLSTEKLPHYFIDKCNMMETIPERYMRQIQARVRNIKDNIPIYLMHTMYRMRTAEDFYPMLDILELYKLVTRKTFGLGQLNPQLLQLGDADEFQEEQNKLDDGEDVLYSDSEEEYEHRMMKEKLHALRKERKKAATKNSTGGSDKINRQYMYSTIRLDKKVQSVKDLRAGRLLSMFAKHFLAMARASNTYRAYPQAYMYLLLAGNMTTLLEESGNCDEAHGYRKQIEELNVASRGGVQDMLGSSWSMTNQHDLMPRNPSLKEQPLPNPPSEASSISGVSQIPHAKLKQELLQNSDKENKKSEPYRTLSSKFDTATLTKTNQDQTDSKTFSINQKNDAIVVFSDEEEESTDL